MKLRMLRLLCVTICCAALPQAHAAGDPARGARVFSQCASCHSIEPGRHLTGPSLANVWGRKAGTAPGFMRYSDALRRSGIVWTGGKLDEWLADPQALVPGTGMTYPGLKDPRARADVIAYLEAAAQGRAPAAGAGGMMGRGMMGGGEPADLAHAGREARVVELTHCRDTYTVRTAAGATRKLWEYNVRLKTDSSDHGPRAGQPVITGSGMRGDRVSIVFASPDDLGRFIRESCD